jgi:hypothetical protein
MKGVLPWLVRCARRAVTGDLCQPLVDLVGSVKNIFPSPDTVVLHILPSPINLGRQSCQVTCLLISVAGPHSHEKYKYCTMYPTCILLYGTLCTAPSIILCHSPLWGDQ